MEDKVYKNLIRKEDFRDYGIKMPTQRTHNDYVEVKTSWGLDSSQKQNEILRLYQESQNTQNSQMSIGELFFASLERQKNKSVKKESKTEEKIIEFT